MNKTRKNIKHILIMGNSLKDVQAIGTILKDHGFEISTARNGHQALEVAQDTLPRLILIDTLTLGTDGYETCKKLKENPYTKEIPVIITTGVTDDKNKTHELRTGADDYVTKPIETEKFLARINTQLNLAQMRSELKDINMKFEQQVSHRTKELADKCEELRKSEELYRTLINNIPGVAYHCKCDENWTMLLISDAIQDICGYPPEDFINNSKRSYASIIHPDDKEMVDKQVMEGVNAGAPYLTEYRVIHADGSIRWIYEKGHGIYSPDGNLEYLTGAIFDITDRKLYQEIMIQTEKMMSLGGLAAGMAHEIKNSLAGIIQNTQVIAKRIFEDIPPNIKSAQECNLSLENMRTYMDKRNIREMINLLQESGNRAARVIENMLSLGRKSSEGEFAPENICDLLDKAVDLSSMNYDIKKKYDFRQIEIIKNYEENLPSVMCEGSKIQQVFMNILKNGAEAMASQVGKNHIFKFSVEKETDMVLIKIADNGPGMSEEVRRKIFEPFFTTKVKGVGTGLGLSVSHFIVSENHKGKIEVNSTPKNGAEFIVRLPFNID